MTVCNGQEGRTVTKTTSLTIEYNMKKNLLNTCSKPKNPIKF